MRGSRWLCKVQRGFMEINVDFKSAAQLFCVFSIRVYIFSWRFVGLPLARQEMQSNFFVF